MLGLYLSCKQAFLGRTAEDAEEPLRCAGSPRCSKWRDAEVEKAECFTFHLEMLSIFRR
jgi:hypothetical protein